MDGLSDGVFRDAGVGAAVHGLHVRDVDVTDDLIVDGDVLTHEKPEKETQFTTELFYCFCDKILQGIRQWHIKI